MSFKLLKTFCFVQEIIFIQSQMIRTFHVVFRNRHEMERTGLSFYINGCTTWNVSVIFNWKEYCQKNENQFFNKKPLCFSPFIMEIPVIFTVGISLTRGYIVGHFFLIRLSNLYYLRKKHSCRVVHFVHIIPF